MTVNNRKINLHEIETSKRKYNQTFTIQNPNNEYFFMEKVPSNIAYLLVTDGQVKNDAKAYKVEKASFVAIIKESIEWANDQPKRMVEEMNIYTKTKKPSLQGNFYILG